MNHKNNFEDMYKMLNYLMHHKKEDSFKPRENLDKEEVYTYCKYCECDMDGDHCKKGCGFSYGSCYHFHGYQCSGYVPGEYSYDKHGNRVNTVTISEKEYKDLKEKEKVK